MAKMKIITKTVALDQAVKKHILDSIDASGYSIPDQHLMGDRMRLSFLYTTFHSEYGWAINRYGELNAFKEWIQGLPSCFTVHFTNHDILTFAKSTGYYGEKMTEAQEEKVLENWFNLVAVKTFQLFRKHKIVK